MRTCSASSTRCRPHAAGMAGSVASTGRAAAPWTAAPARAWAGCARSGTDQKASGRGGHRLAHEVQPVLAEEHLVADEERRRAEHAARYSGLGVGDQPGLHFGVADQCEEGFGIEAGGA